MRMTCILLIIGAMFVNVSAVTAAMQSTSFCLESTTFSSAGETSTSASYRMSSTLGQSTAIGTGTSSGYTLLAGFWYQLQNLIIKGDIDGDKDVDLTDVIIGLMILTGESVDEITTDGDVNNDSKIGLEEILYDLREMSQ